MCLKCEIGIDGGSEPIKLQNENLNEGYSIQEIEPVTNGQFRYTTKYYSVSDVLKSVTSVQINYCPFCGRELNKERPCKRVSYRIPQEKLELMSTEFLLDLKEEVDKTWGVEDNPLEEDYLAIWSTLGFYCALRNVAEKHKISEKIFNYAYRDLSIEERKIFNLKILKKMYKTYESHQEKDKKQISQ